MSSKKKKEIVDLSQSSDDEEDNVPLGKRRRTSQASFVRVPSSSSSSSSSHSSSSSSSSKKRKADALKKVPTTRRMERELYRIMGLEELGGVTVEDDEDNLWACQKVIKKFCPRGKVTTPQCVVDVMKKPWESQLWGEFCALSEPAIKILLSKCTFGLDLTVDREINVLYLMAYYTLEQTPYVQVAREVQDAVLKMHTREAVAHRLKNKLRNAEQALVKYMPSMTDCANQKVPWIQTSNKTKMVAYVTAMDFHNDKGLFVAYPTSYHLPVIQCRPKKDTGFIINTAFATHMNYAEKHLGRGLTPDQVVDRYLPFKSTCLKTGKWAEYVAVSVIRNANLAYSDEDLFSVFLSNTTMCLDVIRMCLSFLVPFRF